MSALTAVADLIQRSSSIKGGDCGKEGAARSANAGKDWMVRRSLRRFLYVRRALSPDLGVLNSYARRAPQLYITPGPKIKWERDRPYQVEEQVTVNAVDEITKLRTSRIIHHVMDTHAFVTLSILLE